MLDFKGHFLQDGHKCAIAFARFRKLGLLEEIIESPDTTLQISSRDAGQQGVCTLYIPNPDGREVATDVEVWSEWIKPGVQQRKARLFIEVHAGRDPGVILELLTHEWCLHGDLEWKFLKEMRQVPRQPKDKDLDVIHDMHLRLIGAATTALEVLAHQELAENTHRLFRESLHRLKDLYPELADDLLKAWRDDIDDYKRCARPGRLATNVGWGQPEAMMPPQQPPVSADDGILADQNAALEDWLNEPTTDKKDDPTKN